MAGAARGAVHYQATLLEPAGYTGSRAQAATNTAQGGFLVTGSIPNATTVWTGSAGSAVTFTPSAYRFSSVAGMAGTQAVGVATGLRPGFTGEDAFLWNADGTGAIRLTPSTATSSRAFGTDGTHQVGWAMGGGFTGAVVWAGSADAVVNLAPVGYHGTQANGVSGDVQVGTGTSDSTGTLRALVWHSTNVATDLTPAGFDRASLSGISSGMVVGAGSGGATAGATHALLWTSLDGAAIDMNPEGFLSSAINGTNGLAQVGSATGADGNSHAGVWFGSADSFVDLQAFLDPAYTSSRALAISPNGTVVGEALDGAGFHAVMWTVAAPEPGSLAALGAGLAVLAWRRPAR
jgi:hypothetical protein